MFFVNQRYSDEILQFSVCRIVSDALCLIEMNDKCHFHDPNKRHLFLRIFYPNISSLS